ncbi:MAG TPA: hypothetical protein VMD91_04020 [Candidatus Sulfotelmatobacter sp.]|nr:hypothetical protein [Candidatus Sulfotelmatobacter sp.]
MLAVLGVAAHETPATATQQMPQVRNIHRRPLVLRNANIVNDAIARTARAERFRINHRGPMPSVRLLATRSVTTRDLAAIGFTRLNGPSSGLLVQTQVVDRTGTWIHSYVYSQTTHVIEYGMIQLTPAGSSSSTPAKAH